MRKFSINKLLIAIILVVMTQSTFASFSNGNLTASSITSGGLCVVAAHMDDELLWMYPALSPATKVIWAGIPQGPAQVTVLNNMPSWLKNKSVFVLGSAGSADYQNGTWYSLSDRDKFYSNYHYLMPGIRKAVLDAGCHNIVTHNPWGEYGHWHHRQIFRAVNTIAQAEGLSLWFDNIVVPSGIWSYPAPAGGDYSALQRDTYIPASIGGGMYVQGYFDPNGMATLKSVYTSVNSPYSAWTWGNTMPDYASSYWKYYRFTYNGTQDAGLTPQVVGIRNSMYVYGKLNNTDN